MFPIVDKPVIQYIIEEIAAAGIEEILIITGENKTAIKNHFIKNRELEQRLTDDNKVEMLTVLENLDNIANIHFITQQQPLGLGHAVWCARSFVGNEPFAVLLGDTVSEGASSGIQPLLDVYREKQSSVFSVVPVAWSEVGKYGIVDGVFTDDRLISVNHLVEKPMENPPSNYAIAGRYVLDPAIFSVLEKMTPGLGGEIQLTDALHRLIQIQNVYAWIVEGKLHDVGDRLGYLQAIVYHALRDRKLMEPFHAFLQTLGSVTDRR